jgi:predicted RNA binding protein YcfA (HicA-like mRNA interferase family)
MARLPVLKPVEVIRLLQVLGFVEVRQRGSHKQFRHYDGRTTTVPCHKGRDIKDGTYLQFSSDRFLKILT